MGRVRYPRAHSRPHGRLSLQSPAAVVTNEQILRQETNENRPLCLMEPSCIIGVCISAGYQVENQPATLPHPSGPLRGSQRGERVTFTRGDNNVLEKPEKGFWQSAFLHLIHA